MIDQGKEFKHKSLKKARMQNKDFYILKNRGEKKWMDWHGKLQLQEVNCSTVVSNNNRKLVLCVIICTSIFLIINTFIRTCKMFKIHTQLKNITSVLQ